VTSLTSCVWAQDGSGIPIRLLIPDGTPVILRLAESVSSAHARRGDPLKFIVVKDVSVGGFTIIHAGTMASGSITEVKSRRFLGIGAKVSLRLDSVVLASGDRVGLRAKKEVKGGSRTKLMVGARVVTSLIFLPATPVFLLTRGHTSTVLKSTEITARIDGATLVLSSDLRRSQESSSELDQMMDYLPARVFNREGREGDMLNLVFIAHRADLEHAFEQANWVQTDKWKPALIWNLLRHRMHYTRLPMARFYLFGRIQDYSYALPDPDAVVARRHHIRIWKTDYVLNGKVIWVGAATHDVAIEVAKRGRLINHRIDPQVDAERDFIRANLTEALSVTQQEYLDGVDPVFEAETSSGASYHSDSRILLLHLDPIAPTRTGLPPTGVEGTSWPTAAWAESFHSNLSSY